MDGGLRRLRVHVLTDATLCASDEKEKEALLQMRLCGGPRSEGKKSPCCKGRNAERAWKRWSYCKFTDVNGLRQVYVNMNATSVSVNGTEINP